MSAKDLRHPIKRARGLGSAQSGVGHWWTQRVTAVALLVLGLWFLVSVLRIAHGGFDAAHALVARPFNAVLLIAFLVAMFWHAALGVQVVIEDYVHTRWKEVSLLVLVKFLAVLGALASVLAVLRIALGA